jgi:hypothetical protein
MARPTSVQRSRAAPPIRPGTLTRVPSTYHAHAFAMCYLPLVLVLVDGGRRSLAHRPGR